MLCPEYSHPGSVLRQETGVGQRYLFLWRGHRFLRVADCHQIQRRLLRTKHDVSAASNVYVKHHHSRDVISSPEFYVQRYIKQQCQLSYFKQPGTAAWLTEISLDTEMTLSAETTMRASPIDPLFVSENTMVPSTIDEINVFVSKPNCNANSAVDSALETNSGFRWKLLRNPLLLMFAFTLSISDSSYGNVYMLMPPHATTMGFSETKGALLVSLLGSHKPCLVWLPAGSSTATSSTRSTFTCVHCSCPERRSA